MGDVSPLRMTTSRGLTPSSLATSAHNSALALPRSGAALTLSLSVPSVGCQGSKAPRGHRQREVPRRDGGGEEEGIMRD